jgi:integrase
MGVRQYKSGSYYLDYRFNGRRVREMVGPNKKVADTIWHKRQSEMAENKFLDKRSDEKIRFKDFARVYLDNYAKVNKGSWQCDERYIKKWAEHFGDKLLVEISPMEIEKYKAKRLAEKASPAYINRELACLKCIFNKAILWKKFYQLNPMKGVKLFKENNQRARYLEKAAMFCLLNECRGELKSIVMVAANTGMRRGEIAALKWNDIDLHADNIYIRKSKSGHSRIVPMNRAVKEVFTSLYVRKMPSSEYVFEGRHREGFEAAVERAEILNFKFHDLRHHFASHASMAGMDMNTLRELLGHRTLAMTQRYSHLSPNHKSQAVKLLDAFWTGSDSEEILKNEKSEAMH